MDTQNESHVKLERRDFGSINLKHLGRSGSRMNLLKNEMSSNDIEYEATPAG